MDIHLTATGTPGQVKEDLSKQLKALRSDKPDGWPGALAGIRDDISHELQRSGAESVQVDLHVTFDVTPIGAADVVRAFNAGQPLPGARLSEFERQNKGEIEARRAQNAGASPAPGDLSSTQRRSDASLSAGPASTIAPSTDPNTTT